MPRDTPQTRNAPNVLRRFVDRLLERFTSERSVTITITDLRTGEARTFKDRGWKNAALTCDCMRAVHFAVAGGEAYDPDDEPEECSTGKLYALVVQDWRTGEVLYHEPVRGKRDFEEQEDVHCFA